MSPGRVGHPLWSVCSLNVGTTIEMSVAAMRFLDRHFDKRIPFTHVVR
jgi:hypothetical protein